MFLYRFLHGLSFRHTYIQKFRVPSGRTETHDRRQHPDVRTEECDIGRGPRRPGQAGEGHRVPTRRRARCVRDLDVQFFQNQNAVTNGFNTPAKTGPGQVFAPPGAPQSLLLTQAAVNAGAAFPLLDAKTGNTFYPTFTLSNGYYITQDTPRLHVGNSVGQSLTILYVFEIFTMYFVVVFPEQSIYAIANCH